MTGFLADPPGEGATALLLELKAILIVTGIELQHLRENLT